MSKFEQSTSSSNGDIDPGGLNLSVPVILFSLYTFKIINLCTNPFTYAITCHRNIQDLKKDKWYNLLVLFGQWHSNSKNDGFLTRQFCLNSCKQTKRVWEPLTEEFSIEFVLQTSKPYFKNVLLQANPAVFIILLATKLCDQSEMLRLCSAKIYLLFRFRQVKDELLDSHSFFGNQQYNILCNIIKNMTG